MAIAVANKIYMLEHAVYSVISPEGCASILFKDAGQAQRAAESLKLTAEDAKGLGIVDGIISEPEGGAHRDLFGIATRIRETILKDLQKMNKTSGKKLREARQEKFLGMGRVKNMPKLVKVKH